MDENEILSNALDSKQTKIENLNLQLENQKKIYEDKIKNLMNSINLLKQKATKLENESNNDVRVNIIKDLRNERKDQELIIALLKKKLANDQATDKYLLDEMTKKQGENRIPTYEDMKIKIKQLESDIVNLKYKIQNQREQKDSKEEGEDSAATTKRLKSSKGTGTMLNNFVKTKNPETKEIIKQLKEEYDKEKENLNEKINILESHIEILTETNKKLELTQNNVFEKLKSYNAEVNEIKSVYDTIQKNLKDDYDQKLNLLKKELEISQEQGAALKLKVKEILKISDKKDDEDKEIIEKLSNENELLKKILNGKKQEVIILEEETQRLKELFEKQDSKDIFKIKKTERETDDLKIKLKEQIDKAKFYEGLVIKKEFEIEQIKHHCEDLEERILEKDSEIELLTMKLEEMEELNFGIRKDSILI